tara:strand:+ start:292 stop:459 length:168 start_codon:yes stop_codon:yes gene_type:complete
MKTYYVTVEGIVSRVERVQAKNVADAMVEAKREFAAKVGGYFNKSAVVVTVNEEG